MAALVTIAKGVRSAEAFDLRSRLASEGIFTAVVDDTTEAGSITGLWILVREADVARALEVKCAWAARLCGRIRGPS